MKKTIERGEYDGIPGSLIKAYFNAQQREQEQDRAEGELELAMSHFKRDNKKGKKKEKKKRKVRPIDTTEIEGIPGSGEYNLFNESLKTIKYALGKERSEKLEKLYDEGRILINPNLPGDVFGGSPFLERPRRLYLNKNMFGGVHFPPEAGYKRKSKEKNFEYRMKLAGILVHESVHLEQKHQYGDFETPAYTAEINFYKNLLEKIKANDPGSYKIPILKEILDSREREAKRNSNYGKKFPYRPSDSNIPKGGDPHYYYE